MILNLRVLALSEPLRSVVTLNGILSQVLETGLGLGKRAPPVRRPHDEYGFAQRFKHGALWGYSEAIPNGKPFRLEGIYEGKAIPSVRKPFEWKGRSEWMALPNGKLCHVFTQPRKRRTECRRIWLDFDGFEWIWMDLIDYIETKMIPKLTI